MCSNHIQRLKGILWFLPVAFEAFEGIFKLAGGYDKYEGRIMFKPSDSEKIVLEINGSLCYDINIQLYQHFFTNIASQLLNLFSPSVNKFGTDSVVLRIFMVIWVWYLILNLNLTEWARIPFSRSCPTSIPIKELGSMG